MNQTCSKTTQQQRDDMRKVVKSVIADKAWFPIVTDLAVRVLPILDELEAAERRIAAALGYLRLKSFVSVLENDVEALQEILEEPTVAKTVAKDDDSKGFEGITQ